MLRLCIPYYQPPFLAVKGVEICSLPKREATATVYGVLRISCDTVTIISHQNVFVNSIRLFFKLIKKYEAPHKAGQEFIQELSNGFLRSAFFRMYHNSRTDATTALFNYGRKSQRIV